MKVISGAVGGQTGFTLFCYALRILLLALHIYPMKWQDMSDYVMIMDRDPRVEGRLTGRFASSGHAGQARGDNALAGCLVAG
ncbi:hypothetical protein ABZ897_40115 [Nonomuraea sp. NPDC046802]|uniref:hypothetical protein n=1 Tax=Nonomuraea sp. NPDC046802 TaxID=3154919 RepID=UPI0033D7FF8B